MHSRSRAGFTLVEMVVGLVITGILSTVIFQLLQGQSRFARLQTAREEVQQNSRVAVELIGGELRGVGPAAIATASQSEIKFALPRATGIVCEYTDNGKDIMAQFPLAANTSFRTEGNEPADSLAIRTEAGEWIFIEARDETESKGGDALIACNKDEVNAGLPAEAAETSRARFFHVPDGPVENFDRFPPGSRIYLFEWVRYDEGPASVPGTWLRRTWNGGTPQPIAGPVAAGEGLVLRYFDNTGAVVTPSAAPDRDRVASIRVRVTSQSRATFGGVPQADSDSTTLYLRNRLCTAVACS